METPAAPRAKDFEKNLVASLSGRLTGDEIKATVAVTRNFWSTPVTSRNRKWS